MKEFIKRGTLGLLIGIVSVYLIPFIISLIVNDGNLYPVVPQMAIKYGSELKAVSIQLILGSILGFTTGISTLIWNDDSFQITSMTIKHFLVLTVTFLPVAWFCFWMQHSLKHVIVYIILFIVLYIIIWTIGMIKNYKEIRKANKLLKN